MKPRALRIERLLAKVEAESHARLRRYCFHFDEVAEAEAQGLPYVLVPRQLSREEWEKKCALPGAGERLTTRFFPISELPAERWRVFLKGRRAIRRLDLPWPRF